MVKKVDTAVVRLWDEEVGAVSWLNDRDYAVFEFAPSFLKLQLDLSPIYMGLEEARRGDAIFSFPALSKHTFLGLPGLLADALPDKFGNSIIDAWLIRNGRDARGFSPVERLCYISRRSIGALEFTPSVTGKYDKSVPVEISELVGLAQAVLSEKQSLNVEVGQQESSNTEALMDILRVGTSAGGARPKAVIAMNEQGNVISGQGDAPSSYEYWILKFDGVTDLELGEPQSFGRIEYAYYLMAKAAGIEMTECRLLEESGRAHFMTKRFDRVSGKKIHMQSLCGIAHYDFNYAGAYSYEQAFSIMRRLRLSKTEALQQFRRMVFNVVARNQDDHTKNIAFLMTPDGEWKLSPAYDVTYSHNPHGQWTNQHQMSINGKRSQFSINDLIEVGHSISIAKPSEIIDGITSTVEKWPQYAKLAGLNELITTEISRYHRIELEA